MKEHPILVNDQVSRNIRAGLQTQDRRPMKVQPVSVWRNHEIGGPMHFSAWDDTAYVGAFDDADHTVKILQNCPYGTAGDKLWFREAFSFEDFLDALPPRSEVHRFLCERDDGDHNIVYRASYEGLCGRISSRWHPNMHLPRWACRTTAIVKRVWVERAQEITPQDCEAEGIQGKILCTPNAVGHPVPCNKYTCGNGLTYAYPLDAFEALWGDIYPGSWERNEWVWCCEFEVEK